MSTAIDTTMTAHRQVRIALFGVPRIWVAQERVRIPGKALGVIARLAAHREHVGNRENLCRLLWPRSGAKRARHSLSQALYAIRKTLGPESLRVDGEEISIGNIHCDVSAFQDAVSAGDWLRAASSYRGVFAERFWVAGAPDYEQWLDATRTQLQDVAERVLMELNVRSHWEEASELAHVLLSSNPDNQDFVRSYVGALMATGQARKARTFASTLDTDLAVAAREVIEELGVTVRHFGARHNPTAFVGRKDAIAWLEERLTDAIHGPASIALITGEAGIGKTALIERFAKIAVLRAAKVLTASAYEAEKNLPLGVVGQWLQCLTPKDLAAVANPPWLGVVRAAFPVIGEGSISGFGGELGEIGHHRLLESLRRLFGQIATRQPLVFLIDDIHWADSASISFTHYLLRRAREEPILVVGAIRADKEAAATAITDWELQAQLVLGGLSTDEVGEFVRSSRTSPGVLDSVPVADLRRQTGGNPLLLATLLREMKDPAHETTEPPQSIVEFFKPRLQSRSDSARRLLGALCVLGGQGELHALSEMVGLTLDEGRIALDELKDAQLVEGSEPTVLRHGLVGEVALSLLTTSEKQRLYGRAARHMAESGSPRPPVVAVSHDLAGNRKDAFEASVTASKACDVLHARAEKEFFLKLALSNAPTQRDDAGIRMELAALHIQQRRWNEALDVLNPSSFSRAPDELERRAEATRLRIMAEMTGDTDVLNELWSQVKALGRDLPPLIAADIFNGIVRVAYDLGLDETAADVAERIERRLSQLPLTVQTAQRLLHPITVIGFRQGYEAALEKFAELPASVTEDPVYTASFLATKATLLVAAGELVEAEELFAASLGVIERYALFDQFHMINNNLGVCLMEQGRYDEAKRHFEVAVEYAADTSPSQHSTAPDNLTILAYESSNHELALEMGHSLLTNRRVSGTRAIMSLRAIVGLSGLEIGSLPRCRESERELQMLMERHDRYNNDMSYVHIFLARMSAMRGKHTDAIQRLHAAANHYRSRNLLASVRLELERYRLETRRGVDRREELRSLRTVLMDTGAIPLIERTRSILLHAANARA